MRTCCSQQFVQWRHEATKFIRFQFISVGTLPLFKIMCHCSSRSRESPRNQRNRHQMAIIHFHPPWPRDGCCHHDGWPGNHADGPSFFIVFDFEQVIGSHNNICRVWRFWSDHNSCGMDCRVEDPVRGTVTSLASTNHKPRLWVASPEFCAAVLPQIIV